MYIYPISPEYESSLQSEENAAIKIQAGFRGYRVRKQLHRQGRPVNGYVCLTQQRTSRPNRRHQRQRQQHQQCSIMDNHSSDSSNGVIMQDGASTIEDKCATKIQAGVRGFLVRKKQKIATDAATKIQAGFRGFKARKEAQKLKQK